MTASELASILNIKESYMRKHWPYVCQVNEKIGIHLFKAGRGEKAMYGIKGWGMEEPEWNYDIMREWMS